LYGIWHNYVINGAKAAGQMWKMGCLCLLLFAQSCLKWRERLCTSLCQYFSFPIISVQVLVQHGSWRLNSEFVWWV